MLLQLLSYKQVVQTGMTEQLGQQDCLVRIRQPGVRVPWREHAVQDIHNANLVEVFIQSSNVT